MTASPRPTTNVTREIVASRRGSEMTSSREEDWVVGVYSRLS